MASSLFGHSESQQQPRTVQFGSTLSSKYRRAFACNCEVLPQSAVRRASVCLHGGRALLCAVRAHQTPCSVDQIWGPRAQSVWYGSRLLGSASDPTVIRSKGRPSPSERPPSQGRKNHFGKIGRPYRLGGSLQGQLLKTRKESRWEGEAYGHSQRKIIARRAAHDVLAHDTACGCG